jgi:hypothetical protein
MVAIRIAIPAILLSMDDMSGRLGGRPLAGLWW